MNTSDIMFIQGMIGLLLLFILVSSVTNKILFKKDTSVFGEFTIVCPLVFIIGFINLVIFGLVIRSLEVMAIVSIIAIISLGILAIINQVHVKILKEGLDAIKNRLNSMGRL